jgi:hypothetical protein
MTLALTVHKGSNVPTTPTNEEVPMIRNLMLAAGLFTFTAGSAMAATQPHAARTHHKVAQAAEAPAMGDAAKEPKKPAKKGHKSTKKTKASAEGAKTDAPAAPAPAPAPTPAPAK